MDHDRIVLQLIFRNLQKNMKAWWLQKKNWNQKIQNWKMKSQKWLESMKPFLNRDQNLISDQKIYQTDLVSDFQCPSGIPDPRMINSILSNAERETESEVCWKWRPEESSSSFWEQLACVFNNKWTWSSNTAIHQTSSPTISSDRWSHSKINKPKKTDKSM